MALAPVPARIGGVVISNPDKLLWPDEGITKLALAAFYARVATELQPWMAARAVTMGRSPDGIRKTCSYQKQAPEPLPRDIPTGSIPVATTGRDVEYIVGGARKTLLTLVNDGCIAMHVMNSRIQHLSEPDWLAFDIDPSEGFEPAARTALLLRERLEAHGLEPFVKTSGGRGLHVLVPLRRRATQEQVRAYAASIAAEIAADHPALVTVDARKASRRAPVYLDVMRNASGQTMVPPFSVRWRPHAPVSMPLEWDEVSPRLDPAIFTLKTAERRMAAKTPWAKFFNRRQTLPRD